MRIVEVAQVPVAGGVPAVNDYLGRGWMIIGITESAYHLARNETLEASQAAPTWEQMFGAWVDNLDPAEIDRLALEGLGFGDESGAASYIRVFKQMLGLTQPEPADA